MSNLTARASLLARPLALGALLGAAPPEPMPFTLRRLLATTVAVVVAVAAAAPAASANSVNVNTETNEIWFTASPGLDNHVLVSQQGGRLVITDNTGVFPGYACDPGTPSDPDKPNTAHCAMLNDTRLALHLLDGRNFAFVSSDHGATIDGVGAEENLFYGGGGDDVLLGADGADELHGRDGDDELRGGGGNDELRGDLDQDELYGGSGQDRMDGGAAGDDMFGGDGNDTADYYSRSLPVTVTLGDAADNDGQSGEGDHVDGDVEGVSGGLGGDHLTGNAAANTLLGNGGDDTIDGEAGNDQTLAGGPGADTLIGDWGNDGLYGGPGADKLNGQNGNDLLVGEAQDDTLDGGFGADGLLGGSGVDTVSYASRTAAVTVDLDGVAGDDGAANEGDSAKSDVERIVGGAGGDVLTGNAAANSIHGGPGGDTIDGGAGQDQLFGEAGIDTLRSDDGEADTSDCGPDSDTAFADTLDMVSGCELPQGSMTTGDPSTPQIATARIDSERVRLTRRGRVVLRLSCAGTQGSACSGVLRLERLAHGKARPAGERRYSITMGRSTTVSVRVTRRTRRALARRGRLELRVTAGPSVSARVTLMPRRR